MSHVNLRSGFRSIPVAVLAVLAVALCLAFESSIAAVAAPVLAMLPALSPQDALLAGAVAMVGRTSIQNMREERDVLAKEVRNLMDKTPSDKWDDAAQSEYDTKLSNIERIDASIAREQKVLDLEAEAYFKAAGGKESDEVEAMSPKALYAKWLRKGDKGLSNEEWAAVRNTMSTTTDAEGGFTVQTDIAKSFIDRLKEYGGMRECADVFTTAQGNPLQYPTSDGTSEEGEVIAENQPATDDDPDFGTVGLNVYKFSSKVVTVPIELLQDSSIDIEAMVAGRLSARLGRITNRLFTTGTGTAQPRGVVVASSAGKVGAGGQVTTFLYDDLVDLQHSVDPAYRRNGQAKFMMNDLTLRDARKIKDSNGRPIFNPGYEQGVPGGAPDMLLGAPVVINQNVAVQAASAKSILYGDFKYYKIRDVMSLSLFRFTDSVYTKKGQVGFLAWMRSGGNLTDVSGDSVKHYQNAAA